MFFILIYKMYININYIILLLFIIVNFLQLYYKDFSICDIIKINIGFCVIFLHLHIQMFIYHLNFSYISRITFISKSITHYLINHLYRTNVKYELIHDIIFHIPFILLLINNSIILYIFPNSLFIFIILFLYTIYNAK